MFAFAFAFAFAVSFSVVCTIAGRSRGNDDFEPRGGSEKGAVAYREGDVMQADAALGSVVPVFEAGGGLGVALGLDLHFAATVGVIQQRRDLDAILERLSWGELVLQLSSRVKGRVAGSAGVAQSAAVSNDDVFFGGRGGPFLVEVDQPGELFAPAVVGHVLDVVVRGFAVLEGLVLAVVKRADVVGFAVVVPRDDLEELGLGVEAEDLGPAVVPQVVAVPEPVLVVAREVGEELQWTVVSA